MVSGLIKPRFLNMAKKIHERYNYYFIQKYLSSPLYIKSTSTYKKINVYILYRWNLYEMFLFLKADQTLSAQN